MDTSVWEASSPDGQRAPSPVANWSGGGGESEVAQAGEPVGVEAAVAMTGHATNAATSA